MLLVYAIIISFRKINVNEKNFVILSENPFLIRITGESNVAAKELNQSNETI